jgi:hypothetical protein
MDVQLLKIGNPKIIGFKSYFTGHYLWSSTVQKINEDTGCTNIW